MKKNTYILVLILLIALLVSCTKQGFPQETSSSPETANQMQEQEIYNEITRRVLEDWYIYLLQCERLYGNLCWAVSYLDSFLENHSWDSLQIARAAMESAKKDVDSLKEIEPQASADDYAKLLQSGIDLGTYSNMINNSNQKLILYRIPYRLYRSYLNGPTDMIFYNNYLTYIGDWAHLMQKQFDIRLHILAPMTDLLLLSVDNKEVESVLTDFIAEYCPQIESWRKENPEEPQALMELISELDAESDKLKLESSHLEGKFQLIRSLQNDRTTQANDTIDEDEYVTIMASDLADLNGFPISLPTPMWWFKNFEESYCTYIWHCEDEESEYAHPGDVLNSPPDWCYMEWNGVSLEEYHDYIEELNSYGITETAGWQETEHMYCTYYNLESSFLLVWDERKVAFYTMEGSVCFAPPWYVYYTRMTASKTQTSP